MQGHKNDDDFQRPMPGCLRGCLMLVGACCIVFWLSVGIGQLAIGWHYDKWTRAGITNYSVEVGFGTFAGVFPRGQREFVSAGRVTTPPDRDTPTIERLFDKARNCTYYPFYVGWNTSRIMASPHDSARSILILEIWSRSQIFGLSSQKTQHRLL